GPQEGAPVRRSLGRVGGENPLLAAPRRVGANRLAALGGRAGAVAGAYLGASSACGDSRWLVALAALATGANSPSCPGADPGHRANFQARASATPALLWRSALSTVSTISSASSPAVWYCRSGES